MPANKTANCAYCRNERTLKNIVGFSSDGDEPVQVCRYCLYAAIKGDLDVGPILKAHGAPEYKALVKELSAAVEARARASYKAHGGADMRFSQWWKFQGKDALFAVSVALDVLRMLPME